MSERKFETLHCAQFRHIAKALDGERGRLDIREHPSSDLKLLIDDFRWIGTFDCELFDDDGPVSQDRRRLARAFSQYEQANRIAGSLLTSRWIPGADDVARRCLRNAFNRANSVDYESLDFLWELEGAARLFRSGLPVRLAEPDVRVEFENNVAIVAAFKRPRKAKSVTRAILKGFKQVHDSEQLGVVAVNLESITYKTGDGSQQCFFVVDNQQEFDEYARRASLQIASIAEQKLAEKWPHRVVGIIYCVLVTGFCRSPSSEIWKWERVCIPSLSTHGTADLAHKFCESLATAIPVVLDS